MADANHKQGQKNVDDTNAAWAQFQDLLDKHMPNNGAAIIRRANAVSGKGSLWP